VAQPTSNFARAKLNNFQSRRTWLRHQQWRDQSISDKPAVFREVAACPQARRPLRGQRHLLLKQLPEELANDISAFVG